MKKSLFIFFNTLILISSSLAQFELTYKNLPAVGVSFTSTFLDSTDVYYDNIGFDYSGLAQHRSISSAYVDPTATPYGTVPNANVAFLDPGDSVWYYYKANSSEYEIVAAMEGTLTVPVPSYYLDSVLICPIPCSFNNVQFTKNATINSVAIFGTIGTLLLPGGISIDSVQWLVTNQTYTETFNATAYYGGGLHPLPLFILPTLITISIMLLIVNFLFCV